MLQPKHTQDLQDSQTGRRAAGLTSRPTSADKKAIPFCRVSRTSWTGYLHWRRPVRVIGNVGTLGPSGTGKTTLGLNFALSGNALAPALFLSFYESPTRIAMKAKALGFNIAKLIDARHLHLIGFPLTEHLNDKVFENLLETINALRIKRLVVDGIAAFAKAALQAERLPSFLAAVIGELRARDVTTSRRS